MNTQSVLQNNNNQAVQSLLKEDEKMVPQKPGVAQPSSLFQKYMDTGLSVFKYAAGHAYDALTSDSNPLVHLLSWHATYQGETNHQLADDETKNVKSIMSGLAGAETVGVKGDKYLATNHNKNGTTDYGKYQVNQEVLKELSPRYLGRQVSPQEFLASPQLQDTFTQNRVTHMLRQGNDKEHIFSMWHHGDNSTFSASDPYVKKADMFATDDNG